MSNESYRNECSNCGFRSSVLAELFILFLTFVGFLFRKHSWNDVIDQAKLVYSKLPKELTTEDYVIKWEIKEVVLV